MTFRAKSVEKRTRNVALAEAMRKILVQLIGGQTLPNIFPILSICPDRVVNIYTNVTRDKHRKIVEWVKSYGEEFKVKPEFARYAAIGDSMSEAYAGVRDILMQELELMEQEEDSMLILNMTGGTKAMSVSAIMNCMQISTKLSKMGRRAVPIVYLNQKNGAIEFATCEQCRDEVIVRPEQEIRLRVQAIIEACGDIVLVSHQKNWEQVYPVARKLMELADRGIRFNVESVSNKNYAQVVMAPLSSLLKAGKTQEKAVEELKKLAALAEQDAELRRGLIYCGLEARDGDFYFIEALQKEVSQTAEKQERDKGLSKEQKDDLSRETRYKLGGYLNFFVGGWWEVIVAHAYQMEHPQAEVLWSVKTATKKDGEYAVETDIIASDGRSLCCISCKRGEHRVVTQELEQHCTRTALLAGAINKRIIAIYDHKRSDEIRLLAKALGLEMWNAETVQKIIYGKEWVKPASPPEIAEESGDSEPLPQVEERIGSTRIPFFKRLLMAAAFVVVGGGERR